MLHNTAPSPSLNLKPIRDVVVNEMDLPLYSLDGLHDINKTLTSMDESKGKQTEHMQIST